MGVIMRGTLHQPAHKAHDCASPVFHSTKKKKQYRSLRAGVPGASRLLAVLNRL
jgi:hypothetical protein